MSQQKIPYLVWIVFGAKATAGIIFLVICLSRFALGATLPDDRCILSSMPENTTQCPREGRTQFLADLESSLDEVIAKYPQFFDLNDQSTPGQPRVKDQLEYNYHVIYALQRKGYCVAIDDRFEEIGVKKDNGLNEQFDIYRGEGYVRRGFGSYRASCRPASF